jgi:hypothetical protein
MIFKGSSRADGDKLADYLLLPKNEEVRLLGIRGLITDERTAEGLKSALSDMDELGKMTRAKYSLFHLAINPNDQDNLTQDDWKRTVAKAEKALGLEGQPRVVVSHLYKGKEHLHVVWSRVDVEQRKCIEMNFSKRKLVTAAREIELELGLRQTPERKHDGPQTKQKAKDIEKHQDERAPQIRAECKEVIAKVWPQSKNGQEFKDRIEKAGYLLAIGDRGVLVMDANYEKYSISRYVKGIKAKDVKEKLGDLRGLATVEEVRAAFEKTKTQETARTETTQTEGIKPSAQSADPTRRHGGNWTKEQHERGLASSNYDPQGIRQDYQKMPWETAEQAADRAARAARDVANDNENYGLQKASWETEAQFQGRVMRAAPPDENKLITRNAQNITALHAERELVGTGENLPPEKLPSESADKYLERFKQWSEYQRAEREAQIDDADYQKNLNPQRSPRM